MFAYIGQKRNVKIGSRFVPGVITSEPISTTVEVPRPDGPSPSSRRSSPRSSPCVRPTPTTGRSRSTTCRPRRTSGSPPSARPTSWASTGPRMARSSPSTSCPSSSRRACWPATPSARPRPPRSNSTSTRPSPRPTPRSISTPNTGLTPPARDTSYRAGGVLFGPVPSAACSLVNAGWARPETPRHCKTLAKNCASCHGETGIATNRAWPLIAGQTPGYLVHVLKAFRAGLRKDPMMAGVSRGLSDADIANLAAYYAGQSCKADSPGKAKP